MSTIPRQTKMWSFGLNRREELPVTIADLVGGLGREGRLQLGRSDQVGEQHGDVLGGRHRSCLPFRWRQTTPRPGSSESESGCEGFEHRHLARSAISRPNEPCCTGKRCGFHTVSGGDRDVFEPVGQPRSGANSTDDQGIPTRPVKLKSDTSRLSRKAPP